MLEVLGYLASVLVAISLMMTSILRLRVLNLIGSLTFALYGFLIHAYPVAAVNTFIAVVNVYFIVRMLRTREFFTIVNMMPESDYLRFFLDRMLDDIRGFMPGFSYEPVPNQITLFVVRDLQPAGLFIGQVRSDGTMLVHLDYVIPGFRDLKVGRYLLYARSDFFRERGVRSLVSNGGTARHRQYLKQMGFRQTAQDEFVREIA